MSNFSISSSKNLNLTHFNHCHNEIKLPIPVTECVQVDFGNGCVQEHPRNSYSRKGWDFCSFQPPDLDQRLVSSSLDISTSEIQPWTGIFFLLFAQIV